MSELKRFVLLEDNHIYDTKKLAYYPSIDGVNPRYQLPYDYPHPDLTYTINDKVKKTSDNILDLVEVGDLVEIKDSVYLHRVYEQIYKGLNNQILPFIYMTIHTTSQYLLSDVNKEAITAIYKPQSNGDYKRYSVEGK